MTDPRARRARDSASEGGSSQDHLSAREPASIEDTYISMGSRDDSFGVITDVDPGSLCSSPSSLKVRLRNTFLDFKEENELPFADTESPRAESVNGDSLVTSPLRRSQSDVTGVDVYIRQRLGSNAGVPVDTVEIDSEAGYSPVATLSPMSSLAQRPRGESGRPVSILSFSPPTFHQSPFTDSKNDSSDFVMVMEEDPPLPKARPHVIHTNPSGSLSARSTQPSTPTLVTPVGGYTDERVTVMLRNIPNKYTQRMLLNEINNMGFNGQYDLLYLPLDFKNRCNVGYAFINFLSNPVAVEFIKRLSGYKLPGFNSHKICEVSWARVQGLKANIQHFRNSPINSVTIPDSRPLLFAHGQEIQFPIVNKANMH